MTQAIRNFAKSLESWLTHAMVNIPEEMLRVKVRAGLGRRALSCTVHLLDPLLRGSQGFST